jgi:hippurate hydrolase
MPQEAVNPVTIGADIIKQIEKLSTSSTVVNLLSFNSGEEDWKAGTSEQAKIVGCYFIDGNESLNALKKRIQSIVAPFGSVTFHEFHSPTVNTSQEVDLVFKAAQKIGVKDICKLENCKMAAEDFSEYLKHVPGCYFLVGAGESTASLHTPLYDFPDEILATAAQLMIHIAIEG